MKKYHIHVERSVLFDEIYEVEAESGCDARTRYLRGEADEMASDSRGTQGIEITLIEEVDPE